MRQPEQLKAVSVLIDNAPSQWHVHRARLTEQWGKPSIAVCDTQEHALLFAAAPFLESALIDMLDAYAPNADTSNLPSLHSAVRNAVIALQKAKGAL